MSIQSITTEVTTAEAIADTKAAIANLRSGAEQPPVWLTKDQAIVQLTQQLCRLESDARKNLSFAEKAKIASELWNRHITALDIEVQESSDRLALARNIYQNSGLESRESSREALVIAEEEYEALRRKQVVQH